MFKIPNVSQAVNNFSEEFIVLNLQQHLHFINLDVTLYYLNRNTITF